VVKESSNREIEKSLSKFAEVARMTRGVRLYLVGSFVLVSLAGCGRGFFSEEREPWRTEAEIACLKSGAVKEGADVVRVEPISGPGICGAEFPLKVSALGESSATFGFADELRPPANIGNQPNWPTSQPPRYPDAGVSQPAYGAGSTGPISSGRISSGPISLTPPGIAPADDEITLPPEGPLYRGAPAYPPPERYPAPYYSERGLPPADRLPRLGPAQGTAIEAAGPVAIRPSATLACPIVSVLDRWLAEAVQPAAQRWFGARVVEIRQISAYSCRGMNGDSRAHISEHAFGNALDIAGFTLADGRQISVREGWKGLPEEQGFLRDVEATACQQFTTVLAPGSNVYHYDHIHVDLMRRASRRIICQPAATSGEEVAARASRRNPYAAREPFVTGSLGGRKTASHVSKPSGKGSDKGNWEDEVEDD
jgi:hypothetical protein